MVQYNCEEHVHSVPYNNYHKQDNKMSNDVSKRVNEIAAVLSEHRTGIENGIHSYDDKAALVAAMPDDITKDSLLAHQGFVSDLTAALALDHVDAAIGEMKEDKGLAQVSTVFKVGQDTLSVNFARQKEVPSRNEDGTMGRQMKTGFTQVVHKTAAGKGSTGELKKVKALNSQRAIAALTS